MKRKISVIMLFLLISCFLATAAAALEPAKGINEYSNAYKSSVYYERLKNVELTGDQRRDIVNVALSQVGYHEGDSRKDFGGGNLLGTENYTEYNFFNGDIDGDYSYNWCASFVTFCARQAGIPENTIINSVSCDKFIRGDETAKGFIEKGEYINVKENKNFRPQAADIIFFLEDGADREYASHVGIVVGADDKYVYTVEGNTKRGIVNTRRYEFNSDYIVGYATPNYAGVKNDYDFELSNKGWFIPGKYKVTAESLNFRAGGNASAYPLGVISKGTVLELTDSEGDWAKTVYDGKIGWVSLVYVAPASNDKVTLTYALDTPIIETRYKFASGEFVVTDYEPSRDNYYFLGWSTTENGKVEYVVGDKIDASEDTTLYPIWRDDAVPSSVDVENPPETEENTTEADLVIFYGNIIGVTAAIAIIVIAIVMSMISNKNSNK